MGIKVKWEDPDAIPDVAIGSEDFFWVATKHRLTDRVSVFLALYQNRPVELDDDGEPNDSYDGLVDLDGEYVHSVGWVLNQAHAEFDNYYTPMDFSGLWRLVGWAKYAPPEYTGKHY